MLPGRSMTVLQACHSSDAAGWSVGGGEHGTPRGWVGRVSSLPLLPDAVGAG
ncbi:hypothetical protein AURDEDRAFT_115082 [Auricularia subglabra TFB-10046 SS5]|nr:hypothetical protein AURDEDRAFT_115082 [Auricularia subglabra TFB-10046 SS5]